MATQQKTNKQVESPKSKVCTKCGKRQKIAAFYRDKYIRDGFSSWCKSCTADYDRAYTARKKAEKAAAEKASK